jgi:Zn-dependent metalloprotease
MSRMSRTCRCLNCIMPPHILRKMLESEDPDAREVALSTLLATTRVRAERSVRAELVGGMPPAGGRRTIFDCRGSFFLGGAVVARSEDGAPSSDDAVNRAFDGLGTTRAFYKEVFDRDSIDGQGMRLEGYVHYGTRHNNAAWDGQEMLFGDGDGRRFTDFTKSLDVIAHELAHGVTEFTANLVYQNQPGALNESMSDVFGSLVKQWSLQQSASEADWLIGADVFTPSVGADALRSLKAPGTAYDNALFGKDPQPDHMNAFVVLPNTPEGDNGGVHINSGIPNKAFYLVATAIGGNAWEAAGHIWYESLQASNRTTQFQEFADTTYAKADQLYGTNSVEAQAVLSAWKDVGIRIRGLPAGTAGRRVGARSGSAEWDGLAALTKQIEALSKEVKALSRDVAGLKGRK